MLTCQSLSMSFAGFNGTPAVENLQKAMVALAQATGRPVANPGPITGVLNAQTLNAIFGIVSWLPGLPSYVKGAIMLLGPGLSAAGKMDEAIAIVEPFAAELTTAVVALTLTYTASGATPPAAPLTHDYSVLLARSKAMSAGKVAAAKAGTAATGAGPTSSLFPGVPPGTPWYKNYKVWAGVGGVVVAGAVAYKVFAR